MIITGRWAYKKYKKRQADKEELSKTAHAKHGELFVATQEEISNTAVEDLGSTIPKAQRSDLPPSYSRTERDSLTSLTSTLHSSSSGKPATSSPLQSPLESHTHLSPTTHIRLSGHTSPVSRLSSDLATGQPTEIPVHGKWIWVPDDGPPPSALVVQSTPHAFLDDAAAAELPTAKSLQELPSITKSTRTSEESQTRGFILAELDGKQLSAGDWDKEMYMRKKTTTE